MNELSPGPLASLEGSPWGQCGNRIASIIIAADFADIAGNVWILDPPDIGRIPKPCIVLTPFTPSHSPDNGTATQADISLRWMAAIVKGGNAVVNATLANRLDWYCQFFQLFAKRSNRLAIDAMGWKCLTTTVEPGDPRVVEAWQVNFDAEWLAINCNCRVPSAV